MRGSRPGCGYPRWPRGRWPGTDGVRGRREVSICWRWCWRSRRRPVSCSTQLSRHDPRLPTRVYCAFVVIAARIVRGGSMRVLALVTLASIVAGLFGGELLDPIGVPGIWFPFGIGVSRTQYIYAIAIPLLALLIVRTLLFKEEVSTR